MSSNNKLVCVVAPYEPSLSETFIRAHVERLPARTLLVHGWRPQLNGRNVLSFPRLAIHKLGRLFLGKTLNAEVTDAYVQAFKQHGVDVVLAEYGETGVNVMQACEQLKIPLVVHFLGYDASVHSVLEAQRENYRALFKKAAGIIAVSRAMETKLISMGAPAERVHYNTCGVDCSQFTGANPAESGPVFLAMGRFVEKKAPDLTIRAFALVHDKNPEARLQMIGDGPLLNKCQELVRELGIEGAVTFLGAQPPEVVQKEMKRARCFVQHSVQAASGDCEGTPVGILEAGASGLPVVSTRHAGIPDVVIEGDTGLLVDERDIEDMAKQMFRLAADPELARRLGAAAQKRVIEHFSLDVTIKRLWNIIERSMNSEPLECADSSALSNLADPSDGEMYTKALTNPVEFEHQRQR